MPTSFETRIDFLNLLYLKTKGNPTLYTSYRLIGKLLGLDNETTAGIVGYWADSDFIKTRQGYGRDKYDDNIGIKHLGIDLIEKRKEGKNFKVIKFVSATHIRPFTKRVEGFIYRYDIIGGGSKTEDNRIAVYVSDIVEMNWKLSFENNPEDAEKILLQFAKNRIIEKLKEDTLIKDEELSLFSNTVPDECPYNPETLITTEYAEYEVEISGKPLAVELEENKLAAEIIETRDTINALSNTNHKQKLLLLNQERNLLDFFKPATTEEEFTHRLASLAEVSRNLNKQLLTNLTANIDPQKGSVALLEIYLKNLGKPTENIIEPLRQIGRIRNGYPAHTDSPDHVKAHNFFNFKYPISNFEEAWKTLLNSYLQALKELFNAL